jgi:hypothetical protein
MANSTDAVVIERLAAMLLEIAEREEKKDVAVVVKSGVSTTNLSR